MTETQLAAIEQAIRTEHHSELRWPHLVLLDLIAEVRRLQVLLGERMPPSEMSLKSEGAK
jgi:hypothetical protein